LVLLTFFFNKIKATLTHVAVGIAAGLVGVFGCHVKNSAPVLSEQVADNKGDARAVNHGLQAVAAVLHSGSNRHGVYAQNVGLIAIAHRLKIVCFKRGTHLLKIPYICVFNK
jgi:hypothetical protein